MIGIRPSFPRYLSGLAGSAVAMGLQVVIFPWLVVGVLQEPPSRVGLAQMAVMLPNLLLILLGGAVSDKRHLPSYLLRLYLAYLLPFGLMCVVALYGAISYPLLLAFGACYGVITAFVQPARESLLVHVHSGELQRAVATTTVVQFAAQSVGYLLATQFERIGLPLLLGVQMLLFVFSGWCFKSSLRGSDNTAKAGAQSGSIRAGLLLVWRHPRLLPLMIMVAATGFLGFGAYLVAMPLLTRETYGASAGFYAGLQLSFTLGVLLANALYLRFAPKASEPGRILIATLLCRGLVMLVISTHLPVIFLFPAVAVWGMFSGISISMGRVMTHSEAPESHRSRVVSIYQLAFFGAAPIGAWLTGQLIDGFGVLDSFRWLGCATALVAVIGVFSPLNRPAGQTPVRPQ